MLNQLLRSSRGLLVVGAVLAVAAFALVVVLLNQKSSSNNSSSIPTATLSLSQATAVSTVATTVAVTPTSVVLPPAGQQQVVAARDVPAGTKLLDVYSIQKYFKDSPIVGSSSTEDAVDSTEAMQAQLISNTIRIPAAIKQGTVLTRQQLQVLPFSPPGSLSYAVRPGRVAETIQATALAADNLLILPGDFVDVFLTLHPYKDLSSYTSSPPTNSGGPLQTQQLIPDVRVITTAIGGIYTLELSPENAALMKYVKDSGGAIDLMLMSADDARVQTAPVKTNPIVPEYFLTPEAVVQGTPQGKGLLFPFATPLPTLTPEPTPRPVK